MKKDLFHLKCFWFTSADNQLLIEIFGIKQDLAEHIRDPSGKEINYTVKYRFAIPWVRKE